MQSSVHIIKIAKKERKKLKIHLTIPLLVTEKVDFKILLLKETVKDCDTLNKFLIFHIKNKERKLGGFLV